MYIDEKNIEPIILQLPTLWNLVLPLFVSMNDR